MAFAVLLLFGVKLFAQRGTLDDTAAFIHLSPSTIFAYTCEGYTVNVQMTGTNVRVFDLRFVFDSANFTLVSVTPGPNPNLHILPHLVDGDTISVDGFFHPNFTGTAVIASLTFEPINLLGDQSTIVGFLDGQGFSGTGEMPDPINMNGDTTAITLEGTKPLAPDSVTIFPIMADSVCLSWRSVTLDEDNDPISNPWYQIELEDVINDEGNYIPVGTTQDTFFYHDFVVYTFDPGDTGVVNIGNYHVITLKCEP
ncbi:MAG: hypothetical protein KDB65_10505 [Calditrichaeota bacterium]|nr:hypothetical protein [Calditrichota bacterium]MCB9367656.1 hypothetical protein [Calditrichota bacterium]